MLIILGYINSKFCCLCKLTLDSDKDADYLQNMAKEYSEKKDHLYNPYLKQNKN